MPDFYPRPPRGGRLDCAGLQRSYRLFLSTPSARRATCPDYNCRDCIVFLSTPSARRATTDWVPAAMVCGISIHALREEGDGRDLHLVFPLWDFYPRPPRGGRPGGRNREPDGQGISIHALREEGDCIARDWIPPLLKKFLSTPSARRATHGPVCHRRQLAISIHALREEGDQNCK